MLTIDGSVGGILGQDEVPLPPTAGQRGRRSRRRADFAPWVTPGVKGRSHQPGVPDCRHNDNDNDNKNDNNNNKVSSNKSVGQMPLPWVTLLV